MYMVFYSTNDVFRAEELLISAGIECKVVPTPVQDKAYCGVCVQTEAEDAAEFLDDMEYTVVR